MSEVFEKEEEGLSIVQQCILLSIYRSGIYYQPVSEIDLDLEIMLEIDKYYTLHPYYGTRRMLDYLKEKGYIVGRKAVRSYYIKMRIRAIYPKKVSNTSKPNKEHKIFPYLLRNLISFIF
jgi:putative transposase